MELQSGLDLYVRGRPGAFVALAGQCVREVKATLDGFESMSELHGARVH